MSSKLDLKKGLVYPGVFLGTNVRVDEGVLLGLPREDRKKVRTSIGKNSIFRAYSVIYAGVKIGENFQTGTHVLIREDNSIGKGVVVWHGSTLNPGNVIGDYSRIHAGCFLEQVKLGKRVFLGPGVIFTNDPHPTAPPTHSCMEGAVVEDGAAIGANVTILPHLHIGKRAIIGAGSVVTKDVPAGQVWVGNPAKFLKRIEEISCEVKKKVHYPYKEFWKIK